MTDFFSILADPTDKGELILDKEKNLLYNPRTHKAYPIKQGIAELLPSKAVDVYGDERCLYTEKERR